MQDQSAGMQTLVSNSENLTPLIIKDDAEAFAKALTLPLGLDLFLQCLEEALVHSATKVLHRLNQIVSAPKKRQNQNYPFKHIRNRHPKEIIRLLGIEYSEFFRQNKSLQLLRLSLIEKTVQPIRATSIIAAITGSIDFFEKLPAGIPDLSREDSPPLIVIAAANNQVELVKYLQAHNQNADELMYHKNAVIAAILSNANPVFEHLVTTHLDPQRVLVISQHWPCKHPDANSIVKLLVKLQRYQQLMQLAQKGKFIAAEIMEQAIIRGNKGLIDLCEKQHIALPENSLSLAAKYGHSHLIRYLHNKGFSVNNFDDEGLNPLFYAVSNNHLETVMELVNVDVDADLLAGNNDGETVIVIAIKNFHSEILQFLLENLKNKQKLDISFVLIYLSHEANFPKTDQNCLIKCKKMIDILLANGAHLFYQFSTDTSGNLHLTYASNDFFTRINPATHYLNYLAVNQLLTMRPLTAAYTQVVNMLCQYYTQISSISPNEDIDLRQFYNNYQPDIAKLNQCNLHLEAIKEYLHQQAQIDYIIPPLAKMIAINPQNTIAFLISHIYSSMETDFDSKFNSLICLFNIILKLPMCDFSKQLYRRLADALAKILFNDSASLSPAKCAVLSYGISFYQAAIDSTTSPEIKAKADQFAVKLASHKSIMPPRILMPMEATAKLTEKLICGAIEYSNFELISDFINAGILPLNRTMINSKHAIQLSTSKSSFLHILQRVCEKLDVENMYDVAALEWLADEIDHAKQYSPDEIRPYHIKILVKLMSIEKQSNLPKITKHYRTLINICDKSTWTSLIANATPELLNKIHLCFLVSQDLPQAANSFIEAIIKASKSDLSRTLLLHSYLISGFRGIFCTTQNKSNFVTWLGRLACIDNPGDYNLESLQTNHYKPVLIATLKIRLELVKLLITDHAELEKHIMLISSAKDSLFFSSYHKISQQINQIIHEHITLQGLSYTNFVLDNTLRDCVISLKLAQNSMTSSSTFKLNLTSDRDPDTGKRRTDIDLTDETPYKRPAN